MGGQHRDHDDPDSVDSLELAQDSQDAVVEHEVRPEEVSPLDGAVGDGDEGRAFRDEAQFSGHTL